MTTIKSVCVYCGSSSGRLGDYADAARELAAELVKRRIKLVYGGASIGIMGQLADAVLSGGGEVAGVIPDSLVRREVAHGRLSEIHVTQSMHERKMLMAELSDGFIALPGGLGTLEEIFEIWTWAQLGIHQKPCGLLNAAGYYDDLAVFLDHTVDEGFVKPADRSILIVENDSRELLDRFSRYDPPKVEQWVKKAET